MMHDDPGPGSAPEAITPDQGEGPGRAVDLGAPYGEGGADGTVRARGAGARRCAPAQADRPMAQLLGDFSKEMSLLVHEEVQLAKVELAGKAKELGLGAAVFGSAAVAGLLGAGALVACAIAALGTALSLWLSALVVGAFLSVVACLLAVVALDRARNGSPPVPEQALESTKEDVAWVQKQLKSVKR